MVYRKCDDCKEAFFFYEEDEIPRRRTCLEDCTSPDRFIEVCPSCGGYLFEIDEEDYNNE